MQVRSCLFCGGGSVVLRPPCQKLFKRLLYKNLMWMVTESKQQFFGSLRCLEVHKYIRTPSGTKTLLLLEQCSSLLVPCSLRTKERLVRERDDFNPVSSFGRVNSDLFFFFFFFTFWLSWFSSLKVVTHTHRSGYVRISTSLSLLPQPGEVPGTLGRHSQRPTHWAGVRESSPLHPVCVLEGEKKKKGPVMCSSTHR